MISSYELIIDVDNNIYSIVKGIIVSCYLSSMKVFF